MSERRSVFDSNRPHASFGRTQPSETFLTADIEEDEDYDALNDETFGDATIEGDWEEAHEKLSGLIDKEKSFSERLQQQCSDENDEDYFDARHKEILESSISHLGLEDELDDPAIMTYGRTVNASPHPVNRILGSSPPPPAILDTELSGSPKTTSIWSVPRSSQISTSDLNVLLKSLQSQSDTAFQSNNTNGRSQPGYDLFPPALNKAFTVEELEKDLLGGGNGGSPEKPRSAKIANGPKESSWPPSSPLTAEQLEKKLRSTEPQTTILNSPPFSPDAPMKIGPVIGDWVGIVHTSQDDMRKAIAARKAWDATPPVVPLSGKLRTVEDVEKDMLLRPRAHTVDELERDLKLKASSPMLIPQQHASRVPIGTPPQGSVIFPPGHRPESGSAPSSFSIPFPGKPDNPLLLGHRFGLPRPGNIPAGTNLRNNRFFYPPSVYNKLDPNNKMEMLHRPPAPPGFPPHMAPGHGLLRILPSKPIHHPLLKIDFSAQPYVEQMNILNAMRAQHHFKDDPYAGLMTPKEKEWIIGIQMKQLHTDNPYVDDFYFTTYTARKIMRERAPKSGKGDVKFLLPEKVKQQEAKTYEPMQFKGSLGKLQVSSVNYPRRILDISVSRPTEDEERAPANKQLQKFRAFLLEIEKLYTMLMEIDDLDKKILALSEESQKPLIEEKTELQSKLINGLTTSSANGDEFIQIMGIRKGRNLVVRALGILTRAQKVILLSTILSNLTVLLRKDQHDHVFLQNWPFVADIVSESPFPDLVAFGNSLKSPALSGAIATSSPAQDKSHFVAALQNEFGSSVVCSLINRAEEIFADNLDSHSSWSEIMLHFVDVLISLPSNLITGPCSSFDIATSSLSHHLSRFEIPPDKKSTLEEKLLSLQPSSTCSTEGMAVNR